MAQGSIQPVALDTGGVVRTFTASFGGKEQFAQSHAPIYGMKIVAALGPALKHFSLISRAKPSRIGLFQQATGAV